MVTSERLIAVPDLWQNDPRCRLRLFRSVGELSPRPHRAPSSIVSERTGKLKSRESVVLTCCCACHFVPQFSSDSNNHVLIPYIVYVFYPSAPQIALQPTIGPTRTDPTWPRQQFGGPPMNPSARPPKLQNCYYESPSQ